MPQNHTFEEKELKYTTELTVSKNCRFVKSGRNIYQLKLENGLWQPILDQPF